MATSRVRRRLRWAVAGALLLAIGLGVAWLGASSGEPARGPEPGRSLYRDHCVSCHGPDGRGGWRARLLFLSPGNLTAPEVTAAPDRYLADLIRNGGATIGKPGMPSFGFALGQAEVEAVIAYLRALPATAGPR
jgi:mono/diheme cytochrome c family protein